ncbi:MAG: DUF134 domain-containing protein [Anaerovoracaceae bacterium]|jgi:predicted DNA-binding protein (UPF0251 family)/predicted Fe-Mo cluster-binding NifX family protein
MPRPKRCRRICQEPVFRRFVPEDVNAAAQPDAAARVDLRSAVVLSEPTPAVLPSEPAPAFPHPEPADAVILTVDEYETIRLLDDEHLTQAQCARQMEISRTTVAEMYEAARTKIAACLVHGRPLQIEGGHYYRCRGEGECLYRRPCCRRRVRRIEIKDKGEGQMRIAVTYENGNIFQHFGRTTQFKVYDAEDGRIVSAEVIGTSGAGHGALAGVLQQAQADVLICGGIGGGARNALAAAGIELVGGASGEADAAVEAYLGGTLKADPNAACAGREDPNCHHHGRSGCGGQQ